ncbi:hypothetical protein HY450_02955 [Candidatus Pacearchaeota archaeon]|nr:hypothetical protein [Candidatus Pacearchaeota archaeon]
MKKIYRKSVIRPCSLFSIKTWYEGESKELEKWLGFGFYNNLFVYKNGMARLYYDIAEGEIFDKMLDEKLDEELFDNLCDNLTEQIEKSETLTSEKEIYSLVVRCWPSFTIFDVISKYPEYANERMLERLCRLRKSTELFSYIIEERIKHVITPMKFIFFKGNIIEQDFGSFLEENSIIIEDEENKS